MPDGSRPGHPGAGGLLTVANAITMARLCVVPAIVWVVLRERFGLAFWLFAAAGASDAIDGWLARRRGSSALGALLDPLADKMLLVCMYVALAAAHVLPDWLAILVVFRDLVIVGGVVALSLLGHPITIRPLPISKLNTAVQILLILVALLQTAYAGIGQSLILPVLVLAAAITTTVSGAAYVLRGARLR